MISNQISPDIAALVELLVETKPGDLVSYDALSTQVGRDVKKENRWIVLRAIDVAARDHGAVFGNERGQGYVRLAADAAYTLGTTARHRIKRSARKAGKMIRYAIQRQNEMDPQAARQANAELSVLGLIEHLSADKSAAPVDVHERRPEPVAVVGQRLLDSFR